MVGISKSTPYALFDVLLDNIHAFIIDKNTFALYFTVYLDHATFDKMNKQIGLPINLLTYFLKFQFIEKVFLVIFAYRYFMLVYKDTVPFNTINF